MDLQQRAQLQITVTKLREELSDKLETYEKENQLDSKNLFEKMELMDLFNEENHTLITEINSIENELSTFLDDAYNQDEDGCINCSG